jgi:hypothetical protein
MAERPRTDPTVLGGDLSFHQVVTFSLSPPPLADHLERSLLFEVRRWQHTAQAEWVRWNAEHERSPFPFGRVTIFAQGVLLEAFSERRMKILRDRVDALGAWQVSADERRIYQLPDVIEEPIVIFQPSREPAGRQYTGRDAAELYLRLAWVFLPREDLAGRTPAAVVTTGRGRASLEAILDRLPAELRATDRNFPDYSVEELRSILLLEELAPTDAPEERPHSADKHRPR